ncbi:MAG: SDR family NAD(P)-dependent oxidoreductase [Acidimicrobiaceae bacterium]|nr:SDR family NAD(P)-dependent oxidoreductase [Acidimicrobiaceae bacterium]
MCEGRVAIVTGSGRGIGRGHALELARQGAAVVVNDLGVALDGGTGEEGVAQVVVDQIVAAGGRAVADGHDASDLDGAHAIVDRAIEAFGGLDVVVNNAGVLRDRALVNLSADDWDDVVRVHLRSTFAVTKWAATWWREQHQAGAPVDARVINTSSGAGLYGNYGQANYSAAKAGIVGFTLTAAQELARYGVTVNALAPGGRTRMTEKVFAQAMQRDDPSSFDPYDPENVGPVLAWLASADSAGVTGQVIEAWGGRIAVVEGWDPGPTVDVGRRWTCEEVGPVIRDLLSRLPAKASLG